MRLQRAAGRRRRHHQPGAHRRRPPLHRARPQERSQVGGALLPPRPPRRTAQRQVHPEACRRGAGEETGRQFNIIKKFFRHILGDFLGNFFYFF